MYDIAIVGSGIASSMTLCRLAERLKHVRASSKALRICVIEKEGEMWSGVPYGRRSTVGALAFQKLQEFLEEPERGQYIEWLVANAESWLKTLTELGGPGAARWISDNRLFMEQNRWSELYLPRFLFGLYISGKTARAIEGLSKAGLASVTQIEGEAVGIVRIPGGSCSIAVEDRGGGWGSIQAAKVVLAIGSPPQKSVHDIAVSSWSGHTHIEDIYSPSENINMRNIQMVLSSIREKNMANILILGSNASALEVLYLINYRPEIRNLINSVVVLSRTGILPYKIGGDTLPFRLEALDSLRESRCFSAEELMAAIASDVQRAEEMRLNIADLCDPVGVAVSRLTALMHTSEQEKFVCRHGVHYSKLMRRAGRDTRNAADELTGRGILTTVRGEFRGLRPFPLGNGLMSAVYMAPGDNAEIAYPVPFSITVNCGGFEELDRSSSRLINSVIDNGICKVNSTNRGFLLNERLEASENVYVIGPLVAGNFNEKFRYWHVESASRIAGLAKLLAESLYDSFNRQSEYHISEAADLLGGMTTNASPPYL